MHRSQSEFGGYKISLDDWRLHLGNAHNILLRNEEKTKPTRLQSRNFFLKSLHFHKVTHCIFDMDGTILNSESEYHKIIKKICERYGKTYTREMKKICYGATEVKICETLTKALNMSIKPALLEQELHKMGINLMAKSTILKGVEKLLLHLHANKIPVAMATNASEQSVRLQMIAHPRIFEIFHHMVTISDPEVYRGKPYPDLYLLAASRFPTKPKNKECLVFEDSPIGVEAAVAAGMQVVMVPDRSIVDEKETRKATLVLPNLLHFQPELFGLPPYPSIHPDENKRLMEITENKIKRRGNS